MFGNEKSDPLMDLSVGLLQNSGGFTTDPNQINSLGSNFAHAVGYMQKAQMSREEQRRLEEELKLRQSAESRLKASSDFDLEKGHRSIQMEDDKIARMNALVGAPASVVNNFQGTGYLGGQITDKDLNKQVAMGLLASGDTSGATRLLDHAAGGMFAPSNAEKVAAAEGLVPGTEAFQNRIRELSDSRTIEGQKELYGAKRAEQSRGQVDADAAKRYLTIRDDANNFVRNIDKAEAALNKVPGWKVGGVVGNWSGLVNSDVQELAGAANTVTLLARTILGMPAGNFSNTDLAFLEGVVGGKGTNVPATRANLTRLREIAERAKKINGKAIEYFDKTGSMRGWNPDMALETTAPAAEPAPTGNLLSKPEAPTGPGLLGSGATPGVTRIQFKDL